MSGHENLRPFTSRHYGRVAMNCPVPGCGHQWFTGEETCPNCEPKKPRRMTAMTWFLLALLMFGGVLIWGLT